MSTSWVTGEVARLPLAIADHTGAASDPGTLRLLVRGPLGASESHTYGGDAVIVRDGVGRYHAHIPLTAVGFWSFRWESDAPSPGAGECSLAVRKSRVR
jgi:hypothetical protein